MQNFVKDYLSGFRAKRNTQRKVKQIIFEFMGFLAKKYGSFDYGNLTKVNTTDAFHYFDYISSKKGIVSRYDKKDIRAGSSTISGKISAIRKLYDAMQAESFISANPFYTHKIKVPKQRSRMKRKTETFPREEVGNLIRLPKNDRRGHQLRCLIVLLASGGLRLTEPLDLALGDIRKEGSLIILTLRGPKGGTPEYQPLPSWANAFIKHHLDIRLSQGAKPSDKLLITYNKAGIKSDTMDVRTAGRALKKYFALLGFENCTPHSLRYTFGNEVYRRLKCIEKTRIALRHKSIRTTQIYIEQYTSVYENPSREVNYFSQ
jgi:site-specific recombinase XerD